MFGKGVSAKLPEWAFKKNLPIAELLKHNPEFYLKQIQCPVLAIIGSEDIRVSCERNLYFAKKYLIDGGNMNVETLKFHNLNHYLMGTTGTKNPEPYNMNKEVIGKIVSWIKNI